MPRRILFSQAVLSMVLCLAPAARVEAARLRTEVKRPPPMRGAALKPLPARAAKVTHAPFAVGQCVVCHASNDPRRPGPIRHATIQEQCYSCHDDLQEIMGRRYKHAPAKESCTSCHNPHNSAERGLLHREQVRLCTACHVGIGAQVAAARVKHFAIEKERKCSNCHNPHAANVERILIALPFNLCVNCHSKDGMTSADGKKMPNFGTLLAENSVWHDPVKAKDCSACHRTHGGPNFRLLLSSYPEAFYAKFDVKAYALCFGCHNEKVVTEPTTTTLTRFRDGARNLHYTHVVKDRGRTCRACHEVHAARQTRRIRDNVVYGPKGWRLNIGFTKTATGGSCIKTCHAESGYDNRSPAAGARGRAAE